jgi:hypothetical protein
MLHHNIEKFHVIPSDGVDPPPGHAPLALFNPDGTPYSPPTGGAGLDHVTEDVDNTAVRSDWPLWIGTSAGIDGRVLIGALNEDVESYWIGPGNGKVLDLSPLGGIYLQTQALSNSFFAAQVDGEPHPRFTSDINGTLEWFDPAVDYSRTRLSRLPGDSGLYLEDDDTEGLVVGVGPAEDFDWGTGVYTEVGTTGVTVHDSAAHYSQLSVDSLNLTKPGAQVQLMGPDGIHTGNIFGNNNNGITIASPLVVTPTGNPSFKFILDPANKVIDMSILPSMGFLLKSSDGIVKTVRLATGGTSLEIV